MKIIFIRPKPSRETIGLQHLMIVEPLELEVLSSLLQKDDACLIIDMILEKRSVDYFLKIEMPDIVCVTGYITNVTTMINICRQAKKINPNIKTIVGGVHCEVCPGDLDDQAIDYKVVRNATIVFPLLINYIKYNGVLPPGVLLPEQKPVRSELPEFDFYYPIPDRSLTSRYRKHYFYIFHNKVATIKTSFGCPYSCNFCFCREITKHNYFERPLGEVIVELKTINEKNIYIVDDDFLTSRSRVINFIEATINANIKKQYLIYGRADFISENPDLMAKFRSAGLRTVIVGLESFFDDELKLYNKNINSSTNEKAIKILNKLDIECYATMIIPPEWGEKEFKYCKQKVLELGIHYVNLQPFTPLPGTGIEIDNDKLIIPYTDYAKWDLAHVTVMPTKMGVADFYKNILKLYNDILFQPRYLMKYIHKSSLSMQWKMLSGSIRVSRQYKKKIREVEGYA